MARYRHKVSGARVQVRDDKVMDSSWVAETEVEPQAEQGAGVRKPPAKRSAK